MDGFVKVLKCHVWKGEIMFVLIIFSEPHALKLFIYDKI